MKLSFTIKTIQYETIFVNINFKDYIHNLEIFFENGQITECFFDKTQNQIYLKIRFYKMKYNKCKILYSSDHGILFNLFNNSLNLDIINRNSYDSAASLAFNKELNISTYKGIRYNKIKINC